MADEEPLGDDLVPSHVTPDNDPVNPEPPDPKTDIQTAEPLDLTGLGHSVIPVNIEDEMRSSFLNYSMAVIISRALPDVRDGLKPVQRRILMAMHDLNLTPGSQHRKSAKIVGECFVKGTLVNTPQGQISIEQLQVGDTVYTQHGERAVTEAYIMPPQELRTVTMRSGAVLTCTPGQQFKVLLPNFSTAWKTADELTSDDYIVSRHVAPLACVQMAGEYIVDDDLAYLLGFFLADGWVDREEKRGIHRLSFACQDEGVIAHLDAILMRKFGATGARGTSKDGLLTLRVHSQEINHRIITALGLAGKYAHNITVPAYILKSPPGVIRSFLAGYTDGDGFIAGNRNRLVLVSISEPFLRSVQTLLHSQGVHSKLYRTAAKNSVAKGRIVIGQYASFSLEVSSRSLHRLLLPDNHGNDGLPLRHTEKSARLAERIASFSKLPEQADLIPNMGAATRDSLSDSHLGGGWHTNTEGTKIRLKTCSESGAKIRYGLNSVRRVYRNHFSEQNACQQLSAIGSPLADVLAHFNDKNITFARVQAVTLADAQVTYDIQVEGEHEFLANGLVVHNCMGNYHPHGDAAIYATMVRMAQPFNMRYMLVDGQGNMGSVDGDPPAAQRYTEARMGVFAVNLLADLDKDTVDWTENYDQTRQEPTVLPAAFPNFLCNGGEGIAVGMATKVPPHNLREVVDALIHLVDKPNATIDDLMEHIQGPDFPTAALILGKKGIRQAYETGRGTVTMQAKTEIDSLENGKSQIIVTELPYQVNKSRLIEQIADLVKQKKLDGITDVNDFSDRTGMRIVITLRRDAYPKKILNFLLKHTPLRLNFSVNTLALVNNQPRLLNLKETLGHYIEHRRDVIRRRTLFDLNRAKARAHILEGLQIAIDVLDDIIALIRRSRTPDIARAEMMERYTLSQLQADAILAMQLRQLTALERDKIESDYKELLKQIAYFEDILQSPARVNQIIKQELRGLRDKHGDERRTRLIPTEADEIGEEDMIPEEETIISITRDGYIKRVDKDTYRTQRRGGRGKMGATTREEDAIAHLFVATTHHYILFFTDRGRVYRLKAYEVPQTSRQAMGTAVVNLINIAPDERITAVVPMREYKETDGYLLFVTECGEVKRTSVSEFANLRASGLICFDIEENDALRWVAHTTGENEVILVTRKGMSIRFPESGVPSRGRAAGGVRGIKLSTAKGDRVVGMGIVDATSDLLVISELGMGKRTPFKEYRSQTRGGSGVMTVRLNAKTGDLADAKVVTSDDKLLIMTKNGVTISIDVSSIRAIGRGTTGVHMINLDAGDSVATVERVTPPKVIEEIEEAVAEASSPAKPAKAAKK